MERLFLDDRSAIGRRLVERTSHTLRPVVAELIRQADAAATLSSPDQAHAFFRAAVAADLTMTARLAYALFLAGREEFAEAEVQLLEAWESARRSGSREGRAIVCYNLAVLFGMQGSALRARQFHQLALGAWFDGGDAAPLPDWLCRLTAAQWLSEGEDESAACRLLRAPDDSEPTTERWIDAGLLAEVAGRHESAVEAFEKAIETARADQDSLGEALALERIGGLQRRTGHWRQADEAFREAKRLHDRAGRFRSRRRCERHRSELRSALALMDADPRWN